MNSSFNEDRRDLFNEPLTRSAAGKRRPSWFRRHRRLTLLGGTAVAAVLAVLLIDALYARQVRAMREAIRAAGEPLTVEDLPADAPEIPDDENMAQALMKLGPKLNFSSTEIFSHGSATGMKPALTARSLTDQEARELPYFAKSAPLQAGVRLTPARLALTRAFVNEHAETLNRVHQALTLERGHASYDPPRPATFDTSQHLAHYHDILKMLALEQLVAAGDGDGATLARLLRDSLRLDRALQHENTLIGMLVRTGLEAGIIGQIEVTINLCGLADEDLQFLQEQLVHYEEAVSLRQALVGERVHGLDLFRVMNGEVTGTIAGTDTQTFSRFYSWVPILPEVDEKAALTLLNGMVAAACEESPRVIEAIRAVDAKVEALPSYCLFARMIPTTERAAQLWLRAIAFNRSMRAALACERFRLRERDWPTDLHALVPDFLSAVPADPFDGAPIRYQRFDRGIKVYSIGENERDDGGDLQQLEPAETRTRSMDEGCALLDPVYRNREPDIETADSEVLDHSESGPFEESPL